MPAAAAPPLDTDLYDQLRRAATDALRAERPGHTLSATALVHEAYLRLRHGAYPNAAAYHVAATTAMRRVILDHAQARSADKRGGGRTVVRWDDVGDAVALAAQGRNEEIVSLDDAISRLEGRDAQAAAVVRLKFYGGLATQQIADALGVSPATVKRDWQFARATLYRLLGERVP